MTLLQRTLPVLLASTMDAMKGFYDEVSLAKAKDARGTHYIMTTVEGGPLARLSQTWLYPAAEF